MSTRKNNYIIDVCSLCGELKEIRNKKQKLCANCVEISKQYKNKESNILCSHIGCNSGVLYKGYCKKHYEQYKKHGYTLEKTRRDNNEIKICKDHIEVVLNNNELMLIDFEDYENLKQYKFYTDKIHGYVYMWIDGKDVKVHRKIMNPKDEFNIDHINGNKLDNRRKNLRIVTYKQNNKNNKIRKDNTSGITGVVWETKTSKWRVEIQKDKIPYFIGYFDKIEDAIYKRLKCEYELFGEYSRYFNLINEMYSKYGDINIEYFMKFKDGIHEYYIKEE